MNKNIIIVVVVVLAVAAGFGYYFFDWNFLFQPKTPEGTDYSVEIPIMGKRSDFLVKEGEDHPSYNSNPPTSGWNYKLTGELTKWENTSYAGVMPAEVAVAKLYKGFVWIAYSRGGEITGKQIAEWRSRGFAEEKIENLKNLAKEKQATPAEVVEELKKIASSTTMVFVSSRRAFETDIALQALGRQDTFNLEYGKLTPEHIQRIWDFILRYRDQPRTREFSDVTDE